MVFDEFGPTAKPPYTAELVTKTLRDDVNAMCRGCSWYAYDDGSAATSTEGKGGDGTTVKELYEAHIRETGHEIHVFLRGEELVGRKKSESG